MGLSHYPWWHGKPAWLRSTLARIASGFGLDVMVVETAWPWRDDPDVEGWPWPRSPDGQRAFLAEVVAAVKQTPGGHGRGVLWWGGEAIPVPGLAVWKDGACALFDDSGRALPAVAP